MGILNSHYMMVAIFMCLALEYFISKRKGLTNFNGYEVFTNLAFIGFDKVVAIFTGNDGGGLMNWLWAHRLLKWDFGSVTNLILAFIATEFMYYVTHWYNHHVNLGWASHIMHHSPTKYNLTLAYRLGITRLFSLAWLFFLPLVLLGFAPADLALSLGVIFFFQFFIHTELVPKLGWIDTWFNTPSTHRVHHSSNPEHYNKNLGGLTMVFDHMFGTYLAEGDRSTMKYGIPSIMNKKSVWHEITCHWAKIFRQLRTNRGFKGKVLALFGPSSQA